MAGSDAATGADLEIGDELELDIGSVAHGGVCVARVGGVGGRVVFVRYALPGERALVRITEAKPGSFCRGEAVSIVRPDPRRVPAPCAHFGPGGCGGCDWQHAAPELQRELKATVVAEQLLRLAGLDVPVVVEPLPGGGFGWRTRVRWGIDRSAGPDGYDAVLGPRRYRSNEVVAITKAAPCLIADEALSTAAAARVPPADADEVVLVRRPGRRPLAAFLPDGYAVGRERTPGAEVTESAWGREFRVTAAGFWQAHRHAAEVFCDAVADVLRELPLSGGSAWDLYGGVGLFAAVLAEAVGPDGSVISVESDRVASSLASANLADLPQVHAVAARVDRFLRDAAESVDAVLLDPPRSGAGRAVCRAIAARHPRIVVYVACDPAALARDAAALGDAGYRLGALRAFDAFPQTHHVECVAVFRAAAPRGGDAAG
jgi:tRNA/tmRNA/rRNA uracil-C5-methylase (TrmA/RlmC/RlmD family)